MNTILLFYKYVFIDNPVRLMRWQKKICTDLGLTGRIIIAHEGINGTIGGDTKNIERYKQLMLDHELFGGMDIKESTAESNSFPRLRIVVRDEVVSTGMKQGQGRIENTGEHLTPTQTHELINAHPDNLIIFDARNRCESAIGTFKNAVLPDIDHFRDLPAYIDNNKDLFKDKQVLMFCTGGIRCERASAYLNEQGVAQKVYQIEGGIHRYVEQFPEGHFRGKNYVFDGRVAVKVNDDILGRCLLCETPCDDYTNCLNARCNKHFICCSSCLTTYANSCSKSCQDALEQGAVAARPPLKKVTPSSCSLPGAL